ncbi:MAG: FecR family protein [Candidatus Buchananbacteria bacterium]
MKKNFTPLLILTAAIIFAAGSFMIYSGARINSQKSITKTPDTTNQQDQEVPQKLGAQIVWIEGVVEYQKGNNAWMRAENNLELEAGDSIETFSNGRVIINLDDGSALRLNYNTKVTLTSLEPNHIVITNQNGTIYNRIAKSERIYEITDGQIVYQSLGTAYQVVNTDKQQGVEVFESKVKVVKSDKTELTIDQGSKYYEKNQINKSEEKKIVKLDTKALAEDKFVVWNKEEDKKVSDYADQMGVLSDDKETASEVKTEADKNSEPQMAPAETSIILTGSVASDGLNFSWKVSNVNVDNGFKLVRSTEINPVYPGNDYQYLTNAATRSYKWKMSDGQTYYFRICQYLGGKCGKYSNNVKLTAPKKVTEATETEGDVTSITLSGSHDGQVSWKTNGYSEQGFKIVWSKISNPTYPCRESDQYQYLSDPAANSATLSAFDGEGSYYVRVCEYLGGKCGIYSNQITINLTNN